MTTRNNKPERVIAAIQVRMGSKRLPDKVLKDLCGKPLVEHIVDRLHRAKEIDGIVIATTDQPKDDSLEVFAKKSNLPFFRGQEADVFERLYGAGKQENATAILRLTGDNPFYDERIIDQLVSQFRKRSNVIAFATTCMPLTFPEGLSMELIKMSTLKNLRERLKTVAEREGFAVLLTRNIQEFPRYVLKSPEDLSHFRLAIDYPEDFIVAEKVISNFLKAGKPDFSLDEAVQFLKDHPEIVAINGYRQDRGKYPFSVSDEAVQKAR